MRARDELCGVIDAYYFKLRLLEPKVGGSATERLLQRSENSYSGILPGAQCLPLREERCCYTTVAAGKLALYFARLLDTLDIHCTTVALVGVIGRSPDDLRELIDGHFFKPRLPKTKEGRSSTARISQK